MLARRRLDRPLHFHQCTVRGREVDFRLSHRGADVAGDVQVELVFLDLRHLHAAGVAGLFLSELVGVDSF